MWTCNEPQGPYNNSRKFLSSCLLNGWYWTGNSNINPYRSYTDSQSWSIDHCLISNNGPEICTLLFSTPLMTTVVIANTIKLLVIIYTLYFLRFNPLVTIGDAIVSFMNRPDQVTKNISVHSEASIAHSYKVDNSRVLCDSAPREAQLDRIFSRGEGAHRQMMHQERYAEKPRRWAAAASKSRWILAIFLSVSYFWYLRAH